MGHALEEIHRVLKPSGYVADIRPNFPAQERNRRRARRQIVCVGEGWERPVGTLRYGLVGFRFTDRLVAETLRHGMFRLTARKTFWFRHHFRSLPTFDAYRVTEWSDSQVCIADRRRLLHVFRQHPEARIRVDTPVQLNVMRIVH